MEDFLASFLKFRRDPPIITSSSLSSLSLVLFTTKLLTFLCSTALGWDLFKNDCCLNDLLFSCFSCLSESSESSWLDCSLLIRNKINFIRNSYTYCQGRIQPDSADRGGGSTGRSVCVWGGGHVFFHKSKAILKHLPGKFLSVRIILASSMVRTHRRLNLSNCIVPL